MTTRYYEVTECEHGSVQAHAGGIVEVNEYTHSTSPDWCPGGSRRRVRIDYARGMEAGRRMDALIAEGGPGSEGLGEIDVIAAIVDAALVTEETPK